MTVAELKRKLEKIPDEPEVYASPLAEVEVRDIGNDTIGEASYRSLPSPTDRFALAGVATCKMFDVSPPVDQIVLGFDLSFNYGYQTDQTDEPLIDCANVCTPLTKD